MTGDPEWRRLNRANWDERVGVHLGPGSDYHVNLAALREGAGRLNAIQEAELGPVAGLRILHLQCHFGADSLVLAQRGADVTGVDFSGEAIASAGGLATELGLSGRARFIESDVYAAPATLGELGAFDLVFATWGTICWLPDVTGWAHVVAHFLRPGARFYFADLHPMAAVLDDDRAGVDGRPGWFAPYLGRAPIVVDDPNDYADPAARLTNTVTHQFLHPLGDVITALIEAGLALDWLHEHDGLAWRQFKCLVEGADGLWRWPDAPWVPLSYSLQASRR